MLSTLRRCIIVLPFAALGWAISAAHAQPYPNKPIRIVVPYLAGGAVDVVARTVGQKLSDAFGQPVVVENRAGGASNIGSDLVAKARPDGYTLLMGSPAHALNVSLFEKMPYDVLRDLAPIILMGTSANVLVVEPAVPAKSVRELIALAKLRPSDLTYASGGNATSAHLSGELFKYLAQVNILHVPYKGGGGPAITDVLGGRVTMYFSSLPSALPFIRNNRLRALGVTAEKRSPSAPDIPTIAESGLPGYSVVAWHAFFTTAGTPLDVIERLNAETARIIGTGDARARLEAQGIDIAGGSPADFAAFLKAEIDKYAKLVKVADIRID